MLWKRLLNIFSRPSAPARRPTFRPAQPISPDSFRAALASGDAARIHIAFIDGSRCLDAQIVIPRAIDFLAQAHPPGLIFVPGQSTPPPPPHHPPHRDIVWSCLFAIQVYQGNLLPFLTSDLIHDLSYLARSASDVDIRGSAVSAMTTIIFHQMEDDT